MCLEMGHLLATARRDANRADLNEAQEVFLDGHVGAFEHFGGVLGRDPS